MAASTRSSLYRGCLTRKCSPPDTAGNIFGNRRVPASMPRRSFQIAPLALTLVSLCFAVCVAGFLAALLASQPASAQQVPVFHSETHLIDSTVSVHDASGGLVQDLKQEDLSVIEDGIPQTIQFFSRAEQLPLSIGLILDASGSQEKFLKEHERDLAEFLKQTLLPDDKAFAVCFGNHLRLVSDWRSGSKEDQQAIRDALHQYDKGDRNQPEIGPQEERDLGTALNDAVYYGITEKMEGIQRRRKVLVVFSDGEENSSEHDLIDTIEAAQDANTLVYAIQYTELKHGKMDARDRYGMRELNHLTSQTGGKTYDSHAMKVSEAFAEIAGELRSLYAVAYHSSNPVQDGDFRKVVIKANRPGIVVRARWVLREVEFARNFPLHQLPTGSPEAKKKGNDSRGGEGYPLSRSNHS
jgi:Ca-activated chloride channel family protein